MARKSRHRAHLSFVEARNLGVFVRRWGWFAAALAWACANDTNSDANGNGSGSNGGSGASVAMGGASNTEGGSSDPGIVVGGNTSGTDSGYRTDKVDLLFVIDNSSSMADK